jgi:hypothetical protein
MSYEVLTKPQHTNTQEIPMALTPFEIRLELLKMSETALKDDYFARCETIHNEWQRQCDNARQQGLELPVYPTKPPFYTEQQVIDRADKLNGFVSQTPQTEVKVTRKNS